MLFEGGGGGVGSKWRSSSRVTGDKKAQNRLYVAPHAVSHSMPQRPQNVIKKKQRRNAGYWNFEYMYSIKQ